MKYKNNTSLISLGVTLSIFTIQASVRHRRLFLFCFRPSFGPLYPGTLFTDVNLMSLAREFFIGLICLATPAIMSLLLRHASDTFWNYIVLRLSTRWRIFFFFVTACFTYSLKDNFTFPHPCPSSHRINLRAYHGIPSLFRKYLIQSARNEYKNLQLIQTCKYVSRRLRTWFQCLNRIVH